MKERTDYLEDIFNLDYLEQRQKYDKKKRLNDARKRKPITSKDVSRKRTRRSKIQ